MKILIIHPNFFVYGGAERQIVYLANYLTDHHNQVSILTSGTIPELFRDLKETRIIVTPNIPAVLSKIVHKFDIINPHNHPAELFHYPKFANAVWQCNEPPIYALEGKEIPIGEKETVQKIIKKVTVIDEYNAKRFENLYDIKPIVIYPGVIPSKISDSPEDKFGIKNDFVVLQVGYLTWTKNQVGMVEIFRKVKDELPTAKLVLAGYEKDNYSYQVKSKIIELGLEKDVIITGYLSDKELKDLYTFADVSVMPIFEQGGWVVAFESALAGIPTIVSDRATFANIFREHNLGTVSKLNNFHNSIIDVYKSHYVEELRDVKKAQKWILENLTWDKFGEKTLEVFKNVYEDGCGNDND